MALTRTRQTNRPDPERLYVAWQGFSSSFGDAIAGQRFRGSDPIVQAVFQNFISADVPESEWPSVFDHSIAVQEADDLAREAARAAAFAEAARNNRVKLSATVMRATRDLTATHEGRPATISKGSTVLDTSPLAREHADAFEAI